MEKEKIKISIPVIVEGKYDKIKLSGIIDAHIVTTDGFGVFKNHERAKLIKKLSENGVVVLTDSDGGGRLIRSKLCSSLPRDKVFNLYVPRVPGKEKRKKAPSKEGFLGVEGTDADTLRELFTAFARRHGELSEKAKDGEAYGEIKMCDFYEAGLTGGSDSRKKRDELSLALELPAGMTANSLLSAVNVLLTKSEFQNLVNKTR